MCRGSFHSNQQGIDIEAKCVSCGAMLQGTYCHTCGERVVDVSARSVRAFIVEGIREVTDVDGRLLRSIAALIIRPGELTRMFIEGRRKKTLRPVPLFFFLNVLFFLAQGLVNINTYNTTLGVLLRSSPDGGIVRSYVDGYAAERAVTLEHVEDQYNVRSDQLARTIVIVQVPLLALILLALYPRRLLYDHLVHAMHLYAFTLALNIMITVGIWAWLKIHRGSFNLEWPFMALLAVYFILSVRGAYGSGWMRSVASGAVLTVGYVAVLWVYRYLLFGLVMWQLT